MLLYSIPFIPRFAEIFKLEIKNVSKMLLKTSFTHVIIYTYFDLLSVIKHISMKLLKRTKILAILSILIYVAEARIISFY